MLERAPSQEVRRGSFARGRRKPRARHVPIVQGSRRFVRVRAPEARLADGCARASEARVAGGCCSRVSGARSANGCSKGVWRAGMRGEDTVGCASPPFANSLADRRTANRRWISRVDENRQQSSDFRIGSLRVHVKPPLARTRLRNFGQNSLRSGASEPPPTRPPVVRGLPRSQRSQRSFALLSGPTRPIPTPVQQRPHRRCGRRETHAHSFVARIAPLDIVELGRRERMFHVKHPSTICENEGTSAITYVLATRAGAASTTRRPARARGQGSACGPPRPR